MPGKRRAHDDEEKGQWVRRELAWPESAYLEFTPHDATHKYGYGGGYLAKTDLCQACGKQRNRRSEIPYEWRGHPLCKHCLEAGVRPVTFHAEWTVLLPEGEVPAADDRLQVEGKRLTVTRAAEELALVDSEVFETDPDGTIAVEGRRRTLRRPSLDVWMTDDPKP